MNIKNVYEKQYSGGNIMDDELLCAIPFFRRLADDLSACGPVFTLAFREANNTYHTLKSYADARELTY